jgi:hypothetical protein
MDIDSLSNHIYCLSFSGKLTRQMLLIELYKGLIHPDTSRLRYTIITKMDKDLKKKHENTELIQCFYWMIFLFLQTA